MSARLRRRLDAFGAGAIGMTYRRLAALCEAGLPASKEAEAAGLLGWLAEAEAARGTPLEALLVRLPAGMALAVRRALADMLRAGP